MIINFEEVKVRGQKTVKCSGCGKRIKRSKTFWQTINPFNKNAYGIPKSRDEIYEELFKKREEWRKKPELCRNCEENGR